MLNYTPFSKYIGITYSRDFNMQTVEIVDESTYHNVMLYVFRASVQHLCQLFLELTFLFSFIFKMKFTFVCIEINHCVVNFARLISVHNYS